MLDRLKTAEQSLVPSFWPVEVLNVLLVANVELALRAGCPLATLGEPQGEAAQALGIPCL